MNRRGFLKFLGLASASTAAAASGVRLPKSPEEKWVENAVADLETGLASHNEAYTGLDRVLKPMADRIVRDTEGEFAEFMRSAKGSL